MKALILTTNNNQIVQVESQEFPTAPSLVWVNCPDNCNTNWTYDGKYFIEPPSTEPTLVELKLAKNEEINQARLIANQSTFTYNNKQIACDQLSRGDIDAINGYVATRGTMPPNWVGGWKAVDNSIVLIPDVTTWNAFFDALIFAGQINFAKSQTLKTQLANATTAEQVEAISW